jgi:hypothetical protein
MNGGNFSTDKEGLETRKELVKEGDGRKKKCCLKMNRCSVTRRCLLGENKKIKRQDAAVCLERYFSCKIGEWYYERR